jgi:hypothetical protein
VALSHSERKPSLKDRAEEFVVPSHIAPICAPPSFLVDGTPDHVVLTVAGNDDPDGESREG